MAIVTTSGYSDWKGTNTDYNPLTRVYWQQDYDDEQNTSSVTIKVQTKSGGESGYNKTAMWDFVGYGAASTSDNNCYISVAVNGGTAVKPVHGTTVKVYGTISTTKRFLKKTDSATGTDWSYTVTVPHDSSGEASVTVKVYGQLTRIEGTTQYRKNINQSFSIALKGEMQGRMRVGTGSGFKTGVVYCCGADGKYHKGVTYACNSSGKFKSGI